MDNQKLIGWMLVVTAFVLLAVEGNVGLIAILLPVSLLLGYGSARTGTKKPGLTSGLKKG